MATCKEFGGSMIAIEFQSHTDIDLFDAARAGVDLVLGLLSAITEYIGSETMGKQSLT